MSRIIKVGRDGNKNDLVISDSSVSREHLEIIHHEDGGVEVQDLGSTNGTYINGRRISGSTFLQPFDILTAGFGQPIRWMEKETSRPVSTHLETDMTDAKENVDRNYDADTEVGLAPDRLRYVFIALLILTALIAFYYKTKS